VPTRSLQTNVPAVSRTTTGRVGWCEGHYRHTPGHPQQTDFVAATTWNAPRPPEPCLARPTSSSCTSRIGASGPNSSAPNGRNPAGVADPRDIRFRRPPRPHPQIRAVRSPVSWQTTGVPSAPPKTPVSETTNQPRRPATAFAGGDGGPPLDPPWRCLPFTIANNAPRRLPAHCLGPSAKNADQTKLPKISRSTGFPQERRQPVPVAPDPGKLPRPLNGSFRPPSKEPSNATTNRRTIWARYPPHPPNNARKHPQKGQKTTRTAPARRKQGLQPQGRRGRAGHPSSSRQNPNGNHPSKADRPHTAGADPYASARGHQKQFCAVVSAHRPKITVSGRQRKGTENEDVENGRTPPTRSFG